MNEKRIYFNYRLNIHVWQLTPVNCAGQIQTYVPVPVDWQVAPFKHGLLKHGLT